MRPWIFGITGASGSRIALRMLEYLCGAGYPLRLVASDTGRAVFRQETGFALETFLTTLGGESLVLEDNRDLFSPIASGSFPAAGMFIVPCSMSTAGRLAAGTGDTLLLRAGDVCIKEGRRLVLSPRETPLSAIHLRNLLALREAGCVICPPMPAFYNRFDSPDQLIDNLAGRILAAGGVENPLYRPWEGQSWHT